MDQGEGLGAGRPWPIMLDVEASGFGRGSYPIEIGLAFPDGSSLAYLLRPEPDWVHWDGAAEQVHGIPRSRLLEDGRPVLEVAALLNAQLAGNRVYSDAWGFDSAWVARLFDAAGLSQHFRIDTVRNLLSEGDLPLWSKARAQAEAELGKATHRAEHDAKLLQASVLALWTLRAAAPPEEGSTL
ncbi:MAG: hypothetical protein ISQ03_02705 [Pseudomonadales bacterium]|jgi:hypothetical protein|nr:hypothetical protein [Pseudomonadales bacterium]MDA0954647.1 hypothetical protein [Pseudomonadota bacterium]